jgi:hypothetical protein
VRERAQKVESIVKNFSEINEVHSILIFNFISLPSRNLSKLKPIMTTQNQLKYNTLFTKPLTVVNQIKKQKIIKIKNLTLKIILLPWRKIRLKIAAKRYLSLLEKESNLINGPVYI